ncbi:retrovirus-related pol polyprotein from transposon TNT 1-94 [Tanacetum coccineum]
MIITPTGLTEGERGFEQTKECYLTEVIPFFKTLKEHFEGIQKAHIKEVKEMKEIFKELEAEVDQNVVDRKYDEIERKNLLIANENLIADCLSKDVFYTATNYVLIVSRFFEMHDAYTIEHARCMELEADLSKLKHNIQKDDHNEIIKHFSNLEIDHLNLQLKYQNLKEHFGNNKSQPSQDAPEFDTETQKVTVLQVQNELFRTENATIKQHYKELYDSIKITRAKTVEKTTALLAENENLKAQIIGKIKCITIDHVKPKMLTLGMYAIDVEPIPPRNRNNREVRLDYLKHLKESVETLCEIVEEARIEKPLDNALGNACFYIKRSQELLEYVIGTCPKEFNKRDKKTATTPLIRKKQVTFKEPCKTSTNNTQTHVKQQKVKKPNVLVIPSTGVNCSTEASGSQPRSNTKNNRILPAKSVNKKKVEDHPRNNKSNLKQTNRVDSSISYKRTVINSNSDSLCKTCNQCLISAKHDLCVVKYLNSMNAPPNVKKVLSKVKQVWKETGKIFTNVGYQWKPTGKKCTLGEQCPLTRLTESKVVPLQKPKHISSSVIVITKKLSNTSQKPLTRYKRRNTQDKAISTSIPTTAITQTIDASVKCYSKHMTGNRSQLMNFVKKFIETVRFWNDHFGAIMGYGDYVIGDSVISRVYYVEGLGHNLFSVGKFYDSYLELAFRKHSCYVKNEDGVELLKGSRGLMLYTISVEDMMKSSPICLLSKASKNKSWLWHRRLNHLNFGTINDLAKRDLVRGLPRLKFEKDHLYLACQLGKSKKYTYKPKNENTIIEVLHTLHIDLFFGALCYPTNYNEDLKKLKVTVDIGIFIGYAPNRKGYRIYNKRTRQIIETIHVQFDELTEQVAPMHISTGPEPILLTPGHISSGLVPNSVHAAPYTGPSRGAVQVPVVSTGAPSSTTINQDVPSTIHSPSSSIVQPPILYQGVIAGPTIKDNPFAQADNDPFVKMFAPEPSLDESSFGDVSLAESIQVIHLHNHLRKWSKDHPLDNIIGNHSRLVSTKKQLATNALWCLYNSVLSKVEPKNVKTAMDEACWFEAMQEEIYEFDRLQVWELVPKPDYVMIIALKWIYKVKLDEYGDVLKNKARLVAKGYRQEEGIDFEESFAPVHR